MMEGDCLRASFRVVIIGVNIIKVVKPPAIIETLFIGDLHPCDRRLIAQTCFGQRIDVS